jgi:2-oxoglutarate ferredoxin oxidoreductase subunit delta
MPSVKVDKDRCKGCEHCVKACPQKVLEMSKDISIKGYFYSQPERPQHCIGCTMCAVMCPDLAITIKVHGTQYKYFSY